MTALLVRGGDREPMREQVVELDGKTLFTRRANLLAPLTLFLRVKEAGRYELLLEGPEARGRIEPFLTWRPQRYQPPAMKGSGSVWDLDPGFYTLTAEPVKRGIVTFTIRPKGLLDSTLQSVGLERAAPGGSVRAGAVFPAVSLDRDHGYTVYLNEQPEVRSGIILRKLPLDLSEPLFVSQRPGEVVSVPVTVTEPGLLRAEAEDGTALELTVDGGPAHEGGDRGRRRARGRPASGRPGHGAVHPGLRARAPPRQGRLAAARGRRDARGLRDPGRRRTALPRSRGRGVGHLQRARRPCGPLRARVDWTPRDRREPPHPRRDLVRPRQPERHRSQLRAAPVPPRGRLPAHGERAGAVLGPSRGGAAPHAARRGRLPAQPAPGARHAEGGRGGGLLVRDHEARRVPGALPRPGPLLPVPARRRGRLAARGPERSRPT